MDMSLRKLQEIVDRQAWLAAPHGVTKSCTWLSNWIMNNNILMSQAGAVSRDSLFLWTCFSKFTWQLVQFSHSVVSDSLWPHEPQHARPPCPSPTPGAHPKPCPLNQWCHPTISSSVVPFTFCPQSFPASGSFPMSQLLTSGGQSIGVSASTSVLPMNTQDWWISFGMDWLDLLAVQGTLKSLLQHHSSKASILRCSAFFIAQSSRPYVTLEKP